MQDYRHISDEPTNPFDTIMIAVGLFGIGPTYHCHITHLSIRQKHEQSLITWIAKFIGVKLKKKCCGKKLSCKLLVGGTEQVLWVLFS